MSNEYCIGGCSFRLNGTIKGSEGGIVKDAITNKAPFCKLGYTQNPATFRATINAFRNGAEICRFNSWNKICRLANVTKMNEQNIDRLIEKVARGRR